MARVTVEDCVEQVPNRFDLVLLAAQRAREIGAGANMTVERDNDKNPVVALREIAEGKLSLDDVEEGLIRRYQKQAERDEPEDDQPDFDPITVELGGPIEQRPETIVDREELEQGSSEMSEEEALARKALDAIGQDSGGR